jgi:predicted GNAT family acetyltransferase
MPEKTIAHAPERSRYELRLDDEVVGVLDYREEDGVRSFTHTGVDSEHRGQGLAGELVEFALRDSREADVQVLPYCWYVRDHIAERREHLDLVPPEQRARFGLEKGSCPDFRPVGAPGGRSRIAGESEAHER